MAQSIGQALDVVNDGEQRGPNVASVPANHVPQINSDAFLLSLVHDVVVHRIYCMSHPDNKRRNKGDEMSARDKKKQKVTTARTIDVQPVPMAHGSSRSGIVTGMFRSNSLSSI
jgi:hypothetical protein